MAVTTKRGRKRGRGFATFTKDRLREISARGGSATWAAGKAYVFTRHSAQDASFQRRSMRGLTPLPMRKREGVYEYQIEVDGEKRWVSRQMVYLLRKKGVLE